MSTQDLLALIRRVGLKVGGGIVIGAYIAYQYPQMTAQFFNNPHVTGLVGLASAMYGVWKSYQNGQKPPHDGVSIPSVWAVKA